MKVARRASARTLAEASLQAATGWAVMAFQLFPVCSARQTREARTDSPTPSISIP